MKKIKVGRNLSGTIERKKDDQKQNGFLSYKRPKDPKRNTEIKISLDCS